MREILLTTFILVLMSLGVHAKPKTLSYAKNPVINAKTRGDGNRNQLVIHE